MMGEYAAFLLILVFGFACGYGTARARGIKQPEAELPSIETIRINEGDTVLVRYDGFLTNLQRAALKEMIQQRFGDKAVQVVLLEAGISVEVRSTWEGVAHVEPTEPWRSPSDEDGYRASIIERIEHGDLTEDEVHDHVANGHISVNDVRNAQARRRDDNRAQRAPEEPWQ